MDRNVIVTNNASHVLCFHVLPRLRSSLFLPHWDVISPALDETRAFYPLFCPFSPHSCVQEFSKSRQFLRLATRLEKVHSRAIDEGSRLYLAYAIYKGVPGLFAPVTLHTYFYSVHGTRREKFSLTKSSWKPPEWLSPSAKQFPVSGENSIHASNKFSDT